MQTIIPPVPPQGAPAFGDDRLPNRFWSKASVNDATGCWEWNAQKSHNGYARFQLESQPQRAHRVSYQALVGAIPEGMTLDHLCRVRHCVNPAHLEPVTQAENNRRAARASSRKGFPLKTRTHCPVGHPYDEANTAVSRNGKRRCRACTHTRKRRYRQEGRVAVAGGAR